VFIVPEVTHHGQDSDTRLDDLPLPVPGQLQNLAIRHLDYPDHRLIALDGGQSSLVDHVEFAGCLNRTTQLGCLV
jgi:hypothetical protein